MNEIDLGKIAITNKGKWEINTPYDILTSVSYNGLSYLSRVPNIGINPEEDSSMNTWLLLAERGESIYNLSVESGKFTGTEEEFIAAYWKAVNDAIKAALDANSAAGSVLDSIDTVSRLEKEITLAENLRVISENTRKENESYRERDEQIRENNEKNREKQEQEREINVQNSINSLNRAMQDASIAELKREQQEAERVNAEGLRDLEFKDIKAEAKDTAEVSNAAAKNASDAAIRANSAADRADKATGNTQLAINDAVTATTAANQATNKAKTATEESIKATEASKTATGETIAAKNETIAATEEAKKATTNANSAADNAKTFEPRIKTLEDESVKTVELILSEPLLNLTLKNIGVYERLKWAALNNPPKWFKDALVCYYNPAKLGLKNGIDIIDGQTFILKDFSPNGLDMEMHGFQGSGMSGMDGYSLNFSNFWKGGGGSDKAPWSLNFSSITIGRDAAGNESKAFGNTQTNGIYYKKLKLKISELKDNEYCELHFRKESGEFKYKTFSKDGIYEVEIPDGSDKGIYFQFFSNSAGLVTIELLPFYPNALIFDGIDDWGIKEDFPVVNSTEGYTIIAIRKILDKNKVLNLVSDGDKYATSRSGYRLEFRNGNGFNIISNFGATNTINDEFELSDFTYQTSKSYNGIPIIKGDILNSNPWMLLGKMSKTEGEFFWNGVLYSLLFFNRDLTPKEIDWVKGNIINEGVEEAPIDGNTYLRKDGKWFDITPTLDWMNFGLGYLPEWFRKSLVCYYNPSKQGLQNGVDIINGQPFKLKDFSPNHLDMTMHGFQGGGMSGMDGYEASDWNLNNSVHNMTYKNHKIHITNIGHEDRPVYYHKGLEVKSFKVKVSGIVGNQRLRYTYYNGSSSQTLIIDHNGEYALPKCVAKEGTNYGFISYGYVGDCDITIEILPSYEDALVFDGTDDYGEVIDDKLILDDYTIIINRKILKGGYPLSKSINNATTEGAFMFEASDNTYNYGKKTVITKSLSNIVYQTKNSYNGQKIDSGNVIDSNYLRMGKWVSGTTNFTSFVLYQTLIFNRTLTPDEIEWVKKNIMGYVAPTNEQSEFTSKKEEIK